MPYISATTQPLFWAVGDPIIEAGLTHVGETTVSGLSLISNADENAFLGAVAGKATSYNPLPDSGWLEAGAFYGYNGGLVIVRHSHNRTEHAPEDVPDLFLVYRAEGGTLEWLANERVYIGTRRLYEGVLYASLRDMTTQVDQWPSKEGILGTLWGVVPTTADWAVGMAYKGDNTQGAGKGDEVTYNGRLYHCLQSHTSNVAWYPSAVGVINVLWIDLGAV